MSVKKIYVPAGKILRTRVGGYQYNGPCEVTISRGIVPHATFTDGSKWEYIEDSEPNKVKQKSPVETKPKKTKPKEITPKEEPVVEKLVSEEVQNDTQEDVSDTTSEGTSSSEDSEVPKKKPRRDKK